MIIYDYTTAGGKNLIVEYIEALPSNEQAEIYDIRNEIEENGIDAFLKLNIRQLRGKLWEIKISQTRIMYVLVDSEEVCFINICKKQKNKTEKKEIEKALNRAKLEGLI